jgi:hypothetical protein
MARLDTGGWADLGEGEGKNSAKQSQKQQQQVNFCVGHARDSGGMMMACSLLSDVGHQKLKHTTISHQNGNQPPKQRPSDGSGHYHLLNLGLELNSMRLSTHLIGRSPMVLTLNR